MRYQCSRYQESISIKTLTNSYYLDKVNPLHNNILYNSKIRYNVNLIYTKICGSCCFSLTVPCYFLGNIGFGYLLEAPPLGDSNKYTKCMMYKNKKKNYSKVSVIYALDGSISSFFYSSKFDFAANSLVKKHCRYNEGPLYTDCDQILLSSRNHLTILMQPQCLCILWKIRWKVWKLKDIL